MALRKLEQISQGSGSRITVFFTNFPVSYFNRVTFSVESTTNERGSQVEKSEGDPPLWFDVRIRLCLQRISKVLRYWL